MEERQQVDTSIYLVCGIEVKRSILRADSHAGAILNGLRVFLENKPRLAGTSLTKGLDVV